MAIVFTFLISLVASNCPSNEWTYCAREGDSCRIQDTINHGFISYGYERWNIIPFTNTAGGGKDLVIGCDNDFGDVRYGYIKHCCYISVNHEYDTSSTSWALAVDEGACYNAVDLNTRTSKYGESGQYVYRLFNANICATNAVFNDPIYGTKKHLKVSESIPTFFAEAGNTFTHCANEDGICNVENSAISLVKYGDNGRYNYRLVYAPDGQIPCNNRQFEDSFYGVKKFCLKSDPIYEFTNQIGRWIRLVTCIGCDEQTYTESYGVTTTSTSSVTNSYTYSLSKSISVGFTFLGIDYDREFTETLSETVSQTISESSAFNVMTEIALTCDKMSLFQFVMTADEFNGVSNGHVNIKSRNFACLDTYVAPECPPGLDGDDCQILTTFGRTE